ncbi:hypothetical protein BXY70_2757 [Roseovarius halotolerans]|uniref:Uncharacterized protein n=1 Tax=Roseovarius halotolerans TaxID=505353 RepID=A0A1X6ZEP7_9RHOB|nr:hypothetical protein BXY70_2757 [Roseovarius halotolerans]SLN49128.1 hypothetical protein ROH8110_02651 [Roseovarius halotolerans]
MTRESGVRRAWRMSRSAAIQDGGGPVDTMRQAHSIIQAASKVNAPETRRDQSGQTTTIVGTETAITMSSSGSPMRQ